MLTSLADHMCHNVATANRYYNANRGIKNTELSTDYLVQSYLTRSEDGASQDYETYNSDAGNYE
jgi:hypothetical protein